MKRGQLASRLTVGGRVDDEKPFVAELRSSMTQICVLHHGDGGVNDWHKVHYRVDLAVAANGSKVFIYSSMKEC